MIQLYQKMRIQLAFASSFGVKEVEAAKKKKSSGIKVGVSVRFAGAVFNAVIGFAVGGGVGVIQSFIIKKGKAEAKRIFTKTVSSRLKAWGAKKLAVSIGVAVAIALNYLDIGTQIAKQLDKRDKHPNNGWVDIYQEEFCEKYNEVCCYDSLYQCIFLLLQYVCTKKLFVHYHCTSYLSYCY